MTVLFQKRRFPENCFEAMDGFTRIPVEAEVTPSASVKTVLLMLFGLFDRDSSRKPDKRHRAADKQLHGVFGVCF